MPDPDAGAARPCDARETILRSGFHFIGMVGVQDPVCQTPTRGLPGLAVPGKPSCDQASTSSASMRSGFHFIGWWVYRIQCARPRRGVCPALRCPGNHPAIRLPLHRHGGCTGFSVPDPDVGSARPCGAQATILRSGFHFIGMAGVQDPVPDPDAGAARPCGARETMRCPLHRHPGSSVPDPDVGSARPCGAQETILRSGFHFIGMAGVQDSVCQTQTWGLPGLAAPGKVPCGRTPAAAAAGVRRGSICQTQTQGLPGLATPGKPSCDQASTSSAWRVYRIQCARPRRGGYPALRCPGNHPAIRLPLHRHGGCTGSSVPDPDAGAARPCGARETILRSGFHFIGMVGVQDPVCQTQTRGLPGLAVPRQPSCDQASTSSAWWVYRIQCARPRRGGCPALRCPGNHPAIRLPLHRHGGCTGSSVPDPDVGSARPCGARETILRSGFHFIGMAGVQDPVCQTQTWGLPGLAVPGKPSCDQASTSSAWWVYRIQCARPRRGGCPALRCPGNHPAIRLPLHRHGGCTGSSVPDPDVGSARPCDARETALRPDIRCSGSRGAWDSANLQ